MEYYSAMKRTGAQTPATTWVILKTITYAKGKTSYKRTHVA